MKRLSLLSPNNSYAKHYCAFILDRAKLMNDEATQAGRLIGTGIVPTVWLNVTYFFTSSTVAAKRA
jgi:hypothetical protein